MGNDQMLVIYAASLIRSIIALHNLINNKLTNKEAERKEAGGSSKESATKKETEKVKRLIKRRTEKILIKAKRANQIKNKLAVTHLPIFVYLWFLVSTVILQNV